MRAWLVMFKGMYRMRYRQYIRILVTAIQKWNCTIREAADHAADCCGFNPDVGHQHIPQWPLPIRQMKLTMMSASQTSCCPTVVNIAVMLKALFMMKIFAWLHIHSFAHMHVERES